MPEYLTEADLIQSPQQDFLTEADLVAPIAKVTGKSKKKKKPAEPVYLGEWQQEVESLAKQHDSIRQVIKATEDIAKRAKPFQGGLASAAQTETPAIVTPMRRGYKRIQRGSKKEIIAPTGLPVTEGTYVKDAYSRHPEVASMRASTPAEAAQLEEVARLSQPGFRTALDRGMLQSGQTLKNFGAGMLGLIDDLGKSIHPTNFVGEATEENLVHALARKLTESSQEDAATLAAIDKNYGSPAEKIAEIGRGLPGMVGSVFLSTQMTGNPALGFAVQKMADARGRGITNPGELATQGILGLAEGALFNKMNQMQMGPGRILAQGAAGAAQVPLEYRIGATAEQLEKKPLPDFGEVVEGALTNVGLDIVMPGGKADPKERATEALQSLPEPDRNAVQFALVSPDPNSFKGLTPKQREAALLNWQLEAHPVFKDETGNPKTFYHGTKAGSIDFFDTQSDGNIGSHFGSKHAANSFADSKEEGAVVYPVYLNIKNPAITLDRYPIETGPESLKAALLNVKTLEGEKVFSKEEINDWVGKMRISDLRVQMAGDKIFKAALEARGFDGIQYRNEVEDPGHISTIAFYPYQVKSAWAKEFDPESTKIEAAELDSGPRPQEAKSQSFKFTQPAARFYEGQDQRGGTIYVNPQMAAKLADWPATAGALNVETKEFGRMLARLDRSDPQAKVLEEAFVEAIKKDQPSVNVVIYSEGTGMWARRLARHEGFHRGQYLASREALKAKGQEGLFQPDIGTIHDPAMHDHPVVQRVANSPIGESIKSRYEESYAPAALTFETAAYMASNDFRRFGVAADEAATFVADYLESVVNKSGVEGLQALVNGTRLIPSIEQKAKEIISGRTEQTIGTGRSSADVSGRLGGTVGEFAESGPVGGGDKGDGGTGVQAEVGPEPPNIYTTVLSSDAVKQIAKKAGDVLKVLGIPENPMLPPHEQIMRALKDHPDKATPEAIGAAMRQLGLDGKDLVEAVDEASKHAGQLLRNLQDANAKWDRAIKEDPKWAVEMAKTGAHVFGLGPSPKETLKKGLAELEASELGRTWSQRGGDLYRKQILSLFKIAATNFVSTIPRLPLDLVDGMLTGAARAYLDPQKYVGKSQATIAEAAREGAIAGAQATMEVAMAFPDMAKRLLRQASTQVARVSPGLAKKFPEVNTPTIDRHDFIISQMMNLHPELHTKLTGLSTGIEILAKSKAKIEDLKSLLPYLNDSEKQKEYGARLDILQKRYDANHSALGKAFNRTGWVYDQFLKPNQWQEFFLRRPYFVGRLATRAIDAGYDLYELVENTKRLEEFSKDPSSYDVNELLSLKTLADLPPDVWEKAADDALTFTYAYNPKENNGRIEKLAHDYIEFNKSMGLIGAVLDAFPKPLYNGLKFAYEYTPLAMIKPGMNIRKDYKEGGPTAVKMDDISRMVKGSLGVAMFATALYIRKEHGGEEWYQIKTGKKDKKGQPIYFSARKLLPFAGMLYVADVALRASEGRLGETKSHLDTASELYLNARRTDNAGAVFFDSLKELTEMMDSGAPMSEKTKRAALRPVGNILGVPLTPLVNLRDMVAQFDEDEAARRDQKGAPILGPAIDKIPWLRSSEKYGLPLTQPPTEQAPRPFSAAPGLTWFGVNLDPGSNFATREFARLGLSPIRWLKPHPDPTINKAQYAAYAEILSELGPAIEADINYQRASDKEKAAYLEALLSGSEGFAGVAKQIGEQANPQYVEMEKLQRTQKPLMRKATGLDKAVQEMKNASDNK